MSRRGGLPVRTQRVRYHTGGAKIDPAAPQSHGEGVDPCQKRKETHDLAACAVGQIDVEGYPHRPHEQIDGNEQKSVERKAAGGTLRHGADPFFVRVRNGAFNIPYVQEAFFMKNYEIAKKNG